MATALAVIAPFWLFGTSKGSDFEFHIPLWLDAAGQWRQGVWFPRWAEQAEYGFGQPTFIFYPPLSWLLGAAVTVVLPLNAAPAGYVFLVALLAGTSMFRLASRSLSRQQAALAAFLYAAGPYPLLLVYQHASFAEVLAGALFPLLLLYALQTVEGIRSVVPLAIVFASVWLSNLPGALIATYSLGLVLLLQSALRRSTAPLLYGGGAIALGLALASFYLLPAWYEQRWVQIGEVLAPGLEPETNFLFGWTYDPVVGWYPVLLSAIAAIEIMLTCVALVWLLKWRRVAAREVQWILLVLAAVSIILMFPISGVAWESLPKLRFVQFPTRWLTVLSASLVMLLSGIVEARRRRVWLVGAAALAFAAVSIAVTTAWHSHAATELQRNAERSQGYFGRPEYMPGQSKYEEIWQWVSTMPLAAAVNDLGEPENADVSHVYVELGRWTPEHKELVADARQPVTLGLRLLAYPAWQVDVNGQRVQPIPEESTGRMLVPIPAGHNEITVHFVRTPDRAIGAGLSLLALLIVCCLLWWGHGKPSAAPGVQARTRKVVRSLEPLL